MKSYRGAPVAASLLLLTSCTGTDTESPTQPELPALAITTTELPNGIVTVDYAATLMASGGNGSYLWFIKTGSLPDGLLLTAVSGRIAGATGTAGTHVFEAQVASSDGQTAERSLSITVDPQPVLQPEQLCGDHPGYTIASFADSRLEASVRSELGLADQVAITCHMLSGLTHISAAAAEIESVVGIQNLANLSRLVLQNNSISDIGPVSSLTSLTDLDFGTNLVTDVSALVGLTNLSVLVLQFNADLTDIRPLVDNAGLGAGDEIYLAGTNPDCAHVAELRARGVTVFGACGA